LIRSLLSAKAIAITWLALAALVPLIAAPVLAHPGAEDQLHHLNQQITQHPNQQKLFIKRGALLSRLGQYNKAQADFARAQSLGTPERVMFELGVHYYRTQQLVQAKSSFDRSLQHFPNYLPALEYRAKVHRDTGNYASALQDFTAFLALSPYSNPGQFLSVAKMIIQEESNIEAALLIIDQGMERLGVTPQLQNYAISLELKANRTDAAIERHQLLAPSARVSPGWQLTMARLLISAKRSEEAKAHIEQAKIQLVTLKKTPANQALEQQIQQLELMIAS